MTIYILLSAVQRDKITPNVLKVCLYYTPGKLGKKRYHIKYTTGRAGTVTGYGSCLNDPQLYPAGLRCVADSQSSLYMK